MRIADVWVGVRADLSEFRRGMAELNANASMAATRIGRTLSTVGAGMQRVGSAMTTNLTLPILAIGGATAKFALDFNDALTKVVALTDVTAEEIGGVREEILKLAPAIGKSPEELAEAFYFLASAGFDAREAMEVLGVAARASAAGLGETQDVARTIGAVVNAYGKENLTAARATDILVAAIGEGTAEAPEFAQSIGQVVGSAAQIGAKFEDVAAAIAAMTLQGLDASEATVSLNQAFVTLFKPTTEGAAALADYGLSAAGLRQQIADEGLLPVLGLLAQKFDGNAEATAAVFGNVRALRAILALTGPAASKVAVVFQDVADSTGSLDEAVSTYLASPGAKLNQSLAELKVAAIEIGEDVLPVVVDILHEVAGAARSVGQWWSELDDGTKKLIVQLALFVAVAGPIISIVGKIASGAGALFTAIGWLTSGKGIPLLLSKLALLKNVPLFAVGGIPDTIVTDTTQNLDQIAEAWGSTSHDIARAQTEIRRAVTDFGDKSQWDALGGLIVAAVEAGAKNLDEATRLAVEALTASGGDVEAALASLGSSAIRATDLVMEGLGRFNTNLATIMGEGVDEAALIAAGLPPEIAAELAAGAGDVAAGAEDMAGAVAEAMAQARVDAAEEARGIIDDLAGVLADSPEELKDELDALKEAWLTPYQDVRRQVDIEGELASAGWATALRAGDSELAADTLIAMNDLLAQYELLEPGALAAGGLVNPAFQAGIDSNLAAAVTWLETNVTGPFTSQFRLADALEDLGYASLAAYVRGIQAQNQAARDAAHNVALRTSKALVFNAYDEGYASGQTWVKGISAGIANSSYLVSGKIQNILDEMSFSGSPPFTRSREAGEGVGETYMGGLVKKLVTALPSLQAMLSGMLSPSFGSGLVPAYAAAGGGWERSTAIEKASGRPIQVNVLDAGVARSVGDIGRGLRELDETGLLP